MAASHIIIHMIAQILWYVWLWLSVAVHVPVPVLVLVALAAHAPPSVCQRTYVASTYVGRVA